ncbi:MAG: c-type cytochrome biogenesis protein CcsB [Aquificota bacterium]|nr:MAG: c-type cytochrome biogenesis protein CcsB [Aquificota bacterium]
MQGAALHGTLDTRLIGVVIFVYLLAAVLYFCYIPFRNKWLGRLATIVALVGWIMETASMVIRTVISYKVGWGHAPFTNLYESMVFFSWSIVIIYLLIEWKHKNKTIGAFVMPFAFIALAYTTIGPGIRTQIEPLIPALQSDWLIAHVITCFLGYAAFAVSCGVSIMYLIKARAQERGKDIAFLPDLRILDDLNYKAVVIGFPLLTLGIITGAAWANYAWGSYWSWDPKETWSLITWLVYAAFLHARFTRGWRGKKTAILSIIGFAAVLFTYLGVNLLIVGLHSYA